LTGRGRPGTDADRAAPGDSEARCGIFDALDNGPTAGAFMITDSRRRWIALIVLCMGTLMIVLDTTVVNVALPSIKEDLGFSETGLVWVVNAYLLTFGGFLLLGGRLGDLYGHRRVFLGGLVLFTLASLACGLSTSAPVLVAARAVQGIGGAIVDAVALSLLVTLFVEEGERSRAMGVYGFVCAGGGSIGVIIGGLLTGAISWHWIFLVNVPIGVAVYVASHRLLPRSIAGAASGRLDLAGAFTITLSLMIAVYAVVGAEKAGWTSPATLALLAAAVALLVLFIALEARVADPMVPLRLFRSRKVSAANVVAVLWAAAMFAWFFVAALFMQIVLRYTPLEVGLAFLPANLIMAACSLGISAHLVIRFGLRWPLVAGLGCAALGLLLFALAPADGRFLPHILPGMILLGAGAGIAFNPVLMAAMGDVEPSEAGLASGVVNTAFMMGGSLGLAVLASVAASRTASLAAAGTSAETALTAGYALAFLIGAGFAALAAIIGYGWLGESRLDRRAEAEAAAQGDEGSLPQRKRG
jgi:EmrB/QacA subfamily drug resistance transporter